MYSLGKKSDVFSAEDLIPLLKYAEVGRLHLVFPRDHKGRPTALPELSGDEMLIAGTDRGLGEVLIVCESLEDAQEIYDSYARGLLLSIRWYKGDDPGFISNITL